MSLIKEIKYSNFKPVKVSQDLSYLRIGDLNAEEAVNLFNKIGYVSTILSTGKNERDAENRSWGVDLENSIFKDSYDISNKINIMKENNLLSRTYFNRTKIKNDKKNEFYFFPIGHNGSWAKIAGLPFEDNVGGTTITETLEGERIAFFYDGTQETSLQSYLQAGVKHYVFFFTHGHTDHIRMDSMYSLNSDLNTFKAVNKKDFTFQCYMPDSVYNITDKYGARFKDEEKIKIVNSGIEQLIDKDVHEGVEIIFGDASPHFNSTYCMAVEKELVLPDTPLTKINKEGELDKYDPFENTKKPRGIEIIRALGGSHFPANTNDLNRQETIYSLIQAGREYKPRRVVVSHPSISNLIPIKNIKKRLEKKEEKQLTDLLEMFELKETTPAYTLLEKLFTYYTGVENVTVKPVPSILINDVYYAPQKSTITELLKNPNVN